MAFQPLNAPRLERFHSNSLQTLENLTARVGGKPQLFFNGVSRGTLGLFSTIGFPAGNALCPRPKIFPPLPRCWRQAAGPAKIAQHLRLLAPVGWFHPHEALAVFESKVDLKETLASASDQIAWVDLGQPSKW